MSAVRAVERAGILAALADHDPEVVGTFPLALDRPGSDVDVLCHAEDLDGFIEVATAAFGGFAGFGCHRRHDPDQADAAVVRFQVEGVPVELFAQPVPTRRQRGFRHFVVERRLLDLGGEELAERIRAARRPGDSIEVAVAEVLHLGGDPYLAVLELDGATDDELRELLRDAGLPRR